MSFIGIAIIIFITHQGMALENDTRMTVETNYSPEFILLENNFSISSNSTKIISKAATLNTFSHNSQSNINLKTTRYDQQSKVVINFFDERPNLSLYWKDKIEDSVRDSNVPNPKNS